MPEFIKVATLCALFAFGIYQLKQYMNGPMCNSDTKLDGKVAIITGANTGIGKETAKDFFIRGAYVVMACRSLDRCNAAAQDILKMNVTETFSDKLITRQLDLSSFASIRKFVKDFKEEKWSLDILVNNAGVFEPAYTLSEDGYELIFAVNHLGHFLLTQLLAPILIDSSPSRVVTVSALGHKMATLNADVIYSSRQNYSALNSYCHSKLCNVLFSKHLGELLKGTGVNTYSLHPGLIGTDIGRHVISNEILNTIAWYTIWPFTKDLLHGAQTQICCAVDPAFSTSTAMYYSDCAEEESSEEVKDDANARWLWEASIKMTHLGKEEIHPRLR